MKAKLIKPKSKKVRVTMTIKQAIALRNLIGKQSFASLEDMNKTFMHPLKYDDLSAADDALYELFSALDAKSL